MWPLDKPEFDRWWRTADSSMDMAQLATEHGAYHHACLHAEQAAQQAVTGLLHSVGAGSDARGCNLLTLGRAVTGATGVALPEDVEEALARLTRHYLPARYPDALPGGTPLDHYTAADSSQALEDAALISGFVRRAWDELRSAAEENPG
jgi:HEPN domain-containing protein